jgi:hypothetical protein
MHATTDRILRRARALHYAILAYRGNGGSPRTDDVAIIVTCEEYADVTRDPFLIGAHGFGDPAVQLNFTVAPTELRLYGILVLPR